MSIIVPAHNEEKYIGRCLESISAAAEQIDIPVEIVVVLNRCSDGTEAIARRYQAVTVVEDARCLAKIRNVGIRASSGDVVATIDADSWITTNMLEEILLLLRTGKYIGGGVRMRPERFSVGIVFSILAILPYIITNPVSCGMFWFSRHSFDAIGGFDESLVSAEDLYFGRTLKAYGKGLGLKYGTVRKGYLLTSCRRFDELDDWHLFRSPRLVRQIVSGHNRHAADNFYYDKRS
jgi:hypothetical protein